MLDTLGRCAQTWAWLDIFDYDENGNEFHIYWDANHTILGWHEDMHYYESYDTATGRWLDAIIDGD